MDDVSKNRGILPPKMDGENNGKPYEQMDDLGPPHYFWKHTYVTCDETTNYVFYVQIATLKSEASLHHHRQHED